MPPQLRLIENEETGASALWDPEAGRIFDYPKEARVIQHEETGQQALFDTTTQSLIAYLPSRVGQTPTSEVASDYQAVTKEYPVEYTGRAGTKPYKPPVAGITSKLTGTTGKEAFRNLMEKAEVATSALSRLAPTGVTEPIIAETVRGIKEGEEGNITRILRQSGAISPAMAKSIGESIPGRAADVLFSGVTALTPKTITDLISGVVNKAEELSPGAGPMLERLMLALPFARFGRATKPRGIQSIEDLVPRRTIEVERARGEPAFVEELKKTREELPTPSIEKVTSKVEEARLAESSLAKISPEGVPIEEPPVHVEIIQPPKPARVATENQSLSEFVKNSGGVSVAKAGALKGEFMALGTREGGKKGVVKMKAGESADIMAQKAHEAGFIEAPDPALLAEALGRDFRGEPVLSVKGERFQAGLEREVKREEIRGDETIVEQEANRYKGELQEHKGPLTYKGEQYERAVPEKGAIRLIDDEDIVLKKPEEILSVEKSPTIGEPSRVEPTEAGMQGVLPETPQRIVPETPLRAKTRQTEKLTPLEQSNIKEGITEADLAAQKLFGFRGGVEGEPISGVVPKPLTPLETEMGHPVTEVTFEGIPKGVTGSRLETGTTKLITEAGIEAFKTLGKELEPDIPVTIQLARAMQRGEVDLRGLERILESKGVSKEQFVESFITTASNAGRQLSQLAKVVKSLKNADAAFGEIGKRLPLYTSILEAGKTFIEKGKLTVGEGSQLARDVIDSIRLNLFSVTSFSLDMIGNATEIGAQVAAGVGKDLVQVAKGHVNFPSLQAVIRTIKDRPRVAGVEKGLELTAIGEKLRGGFQKGPGTFTLRSTGTSKGLDYLVGSPLYLKGVMDTGAKRFSAAMSIWQDAIMAANLKGLKGAERQNFYQKFWEKPPKTVIEKAISEGNKAGFNRTLSKIEEKYAASPVVKLLVDTFGRWPWQFTRWGAEMVGYNPELFRSIRAGKATAEDIAGYLTKTASGWGGLYLVDRALYDHVDFNSMEYVHADGDRTRLSSREPLASALWLLAVIKGDVEKAKGGFKFASVPSAQLLGEAGTPGILGGIIKQAQAAMSRKGVDPRGLSRDLTNFFNRLIPGQAILTAIESIFDPTLREGIGANIPGVSSLKPVVINPATGKPLEPRQEIPGTGLEFPQLGGVPIPGATRKLDPITKLLSKFGLLVYRGPRQPIAGVPAGEAPEEVRREWLETFGQKREKLLSPLIPKIEEAERLHPEEMKQGGRIYEAWRKRIQFYDSIAAKRATAEVNQKRGFRARTKLPRQPTLRELRRP